MVQDVSAAARQLLEPLLELVGLAQGLAEEPRGFLLDHQCDDVEDEEEDGAG